MRVDHVAYQKASRVSVLGLILQSAAALTLLLYGLFGGDTTFGVASWFGFAGIPVWVVLAVVFHQHRLERLEAMEREDLAASRGDVSIFERAAPDQEAAARRLRLMHHWLVPGVSLLVAVLLGTMGWLNLAMLRDMDAVGSTTAFRVGGSAGWQVAVCLSIALVAFIFARFVAGMSRQPAWQNLRGGAGFMVGVALVTLATAVGIVFHVFQRPGVLPWVAQGLAVAQMGLAAEILLNAVLNLYRPRRAGDTPRPAFDSRLLGLLAAPDSLVRGINEAVNYQFGFDIASSWGYKLLLRSAGGLAAVAVVALVGLSCVVVVGPGQQAVRLRGGSMTGRVHQGEVMFKLPWPFETAEVVDIARIRSLPLQSKGLKVADVNVWSEPQEDPDRHPYVVAASRRVAEIPAGFGAPAPATEAAASGPAVTDRLNLVDADLVLNWRIRPDGLMDWLGFAGDARSRREGLEVRELVIREIARREVTQFLGALPLEQVLSPSGTQLATSLRERLQAAFDRHGCGVQVVSIQIPALRPPGESGEKFEELSVDLQNAKTKKEEAQRMVAASMARLLGDFELAGPVVEAIEVWRTRVSERGDTDPQTVQARQAVEQMLAASRGQIASQIRQAQARRWALHMEARRTASRVLGQAASYHAAPRVFMERRIMETLAASAASVRQKYVIGVDPSRVEVDIQMQQPDSGLNLADYLEKKE